jgi:hypothetical protein
MQLPTKDKAIYYVVRAFGIGLTVLALVLSFTLKLRSDLRYDVTAIIGLIGYGVLRLARSMKPRV